MLQPCHRCAADQGEARGVWLVTARRAEARAVDYEDAVVEALRYGWATRPTRRLDEHRAMMWFAPRRPSGGWASSNKRRIERLRVEERLEPAGVAAALSAAPGAREHWDGCTPSARRTALTWIVQAKRAETCGWRVAAVTARAADGRPLA
jgi:hypothetical protein